MAVTRLERKGRKNKARAKARVATIKRLSATPVVKNVDIEAIKAEFEAKKKPAKAATEKKKEVKDVEAKTSDSVEVVEKPKKEVTKKPEAETKSKPKAEKKTEPKKKAAAKDKE